MVASGEIRPFAVAMRERQVWSAPAVQPKAFKRGDLAQ